MPDLDGYRSAAARPAVDHGEIHWFDDLTMFTHVETHPFVPFEMDLSIVFIQVLQLCQFEVQQRRIGDLAGSHLGHILLLVFRLHLLHVEACET